MKASKKQIMQQAWAIAKEAASQFGGSSKQYLSRAMQQAWDSAKSVQMNAFTQLQVDMIAAASTQQQALQIASAAASKLSYETAQQRGQIRNDLAALSFPAPSVKEVVKEAINAEISAFLEREKAQKAAEKKAKAAQRPKTASIKKVCEQILSSAYANYHITEKEKGFLESIKTKRKLTERQSSWLKAIAAKSSVEVGEVGIKKPQFARFNQCQHEDLGSLGYVHGSIVKCPHCGEMAEVW